MELTSPDLGLLVWTTVVFLTVLFILSRFAWKPITTALADREKFIGDALNSAENAKLEIIKLKADNEKLLKEASLERDKILKEAQITANSIIASAKEKASTEVALLIEEGKQQITKEKNAAMSQLKSIVAGASVQIAELVIKKNLSEPNQQNELIDNYMKDIHFN